MYKKGIENGDADALSRSPHRDATVYTMSYSSSQWMSEVILGYSNDSKAQQLLSELALQPDSHPLYRL
jgi:hypothetical protein